MAGNSEQWHFQDGPRDENGAVLHCVLQTLDTFTIRVIRTHHWKGGTVTGSQDHAQPLGGLFGKERPFNAPLIWLPALIWSLLKSSIHCLPSSLFFPLFLFSSLPSPTYHLTISSQPFPPRPQNSSSKERASDSYWNSNSLQPKTVINLDDFPKGIFASMGRWGHRKFT